MNDIHRLTRTGDRVPIRNEGVITSMDEKSFGSILRAVFLMGLFAYVIPVLLAVGVVYGAGLLTGYLLWH